MTLRSGSKQTHEKLDSLSQQTKQLNLLDYTIVVGMIYFKESS